MRTWIMAKLQYNEHQLRRFVVSSLREWPGLKVVPTDGSGLVGFPDLMVFRKDRTSLIELKVGKAKLRKAQEDFRLDIGELTGPNLTYEIWREPGHFEEFIQDVFGVDVTGTYLDEFTEFLKKG